MGKSRESMGNEKIFCLFVLNEGGDLIWYYFLARGCVPISTFYERVLCFSFSVKKEAILSWYVILCVCEAVRYTSGSIRNQDTQDLRSLCHWLALWPWATPSPVWASFVNGKTFIGSALPAWKISLVPWSGKCRDSASPTACFTLDVKSYNLLQTLIHCTNESDKKGS